MGCTILMKKIRELIVNSWRWTFLLEIFLLKLIFFEYNYYIFNYITKSNLNQWNYDYLLLYEKLE